MTGSRNLACISLPSVKIGDLVLALLVREVLMASAAGPVSFVAGFRAGRSLGLGLGQTMGSKTAVGLAANCTNGLSNTGCSTSGVGTLGRFIRVSGNRTCMPVMGFVITPRFTETMDRNCNCSSRIGHFNGALVLINCNSAARCTFRQIITRNQIDSNICRSRSAYLLGGSLYSILNLIVVCNFLSFRIHNTCHSSSGDRFNLLNMADRAGIGLVPFLIDSRVNGIRQRPLMRTSTLRGNLRRHNRTTDRAIAAFAQAIGTASHGRDRCQCMRMGGIRVDHAQHFGTIRLTIGVVRRSVNTGSNNFICTRLSIKCLHTFLILTKCVAEIAFQLSAIRGSYLGQITINIYIVRIRILHIICADCVLIYGCSPIKRDLSIRPERIEENHIGMDRNIFTDFILFDIAAAGNRVLANSDPVVKNNLRDLLPVLFIPWSLVVLEGIVRLLRMPLVQPMVRVIVRNCKAVSGTLILAELQADLSRFAVLIDDPPNTSERAVLYLC